MDYEKIVLELAPGLAKRIEADGAAGAWSGGGRTVLVAEAGAAIEQRRPRLVQFNRPFAFALRDLRTNLVLFAGNCADPR